MPKLKRLSGEKIIAILESFGFRVVKQRGSHAKLKRNIGSLVQTLTLVIHKHMDTGTTHGIFRQASRYISETDLHPHFYSES